jgi:uncharacterized protein (DUF4415 family)
VSLPYGQSVTLRIDAKLLDWLAAQGEAVPSHLKTALRDAFEQRALR